MMEHLQIHLPAIQQASACLKDLCKSVVAIGLLTAITSAYAVEFEIINNSAKPLKGAEIRAVEQAAKLWSVQFQDPITVKINVEWRPGSFFVSDNVLASVQIGRTTAPFKMVRDHLLAEADSGEHTLLAQLPQTLPVSHSSAMMDKVSLTLANAKALGITPANDPHFGDVLANHADAHISFNIKHRERYFFDQNDILADKYDFTGIAAHEIGHALGFTSMVDVQTMNPGVLLNPMLMDAFRFPSSSSAPSLLYDTRLTNSGYAQFNDEKLVHAILGSGLDLQDPFHCAMPDMRCSASHWDDYSGNLMTSASQGKRMDITSDDAYVVDRLGVDGNWRSGIPVINARVKFYDAANPLPYYDPEVFDTYYKAPEFQDVYPNFTDTPTHAFHISFDGHAGAGYAVFAPETQNTHIPAVRFLPKDAEFTAEKQWETETPVSPMPVFPAHLKHFYFQSYNDSYRFNFTSTFSDYGALFDPTLGPYGGFRVSGFLDADLDGVFSEPRKHGGEDDIGPRDYDATITLVLLLTHPHDFDHGLDGVELSIKVPGADKIQDNIIHVIDNKAFDAPVGYNNSSSYEEAYENRVKQLDDDTAPGRDIAI